MQLHASHGAGSHSAPRNKIVSAAEAVRLIHDACHGFVEFMVNGIELDRARIDANVRSIRPLLQPLGDRLGTELGPLDVAPGDWVHTQNARTNAELASGSACSVRSRSRSDMFFTAWMPPTRSEGS